ncbi:MAG: GNAT family N-acetyltransferase, partial [Chloroflexota bacterium]|nr:GNAT family N-acetyltransferase [Chloroflexota bacterium]
PHASLWQLRLPPGVRPPGPAFPESVAAGPFAPDDLPAYVNLINAAFVDHPSPLSVTEPLVRHVHNLPGFDPTDFLVVEPRDRPGHPIAFCRTRLVRDGGMTAGEVVLIGVLPEHRGAGLGTELLRWGVDRLREAGADEITLTVESLNERALRLYERTGFERVQEWPRWSKAT